jgi:serine/threonine protein kinase
MRIADIYEKGRVLGTGTFGEVLLATHKQTGETVAIKKIRIDDKKQVRFLIDLTHSTATNIQECRVYT